MAPDLVSDLMFSSFRLRRLLLLTATSVALFVHVGCDVGGGSANDVSISGRVLDAASNPVEAAQVVLRYTDDTGEAVERTATTDSTGRFARTIEVEGATEVSITVSKQGASVQQTRQVSPDVGGADLSFTLSIGGEENREPGRPTDILLQDQSANAIRVQESGGTSTARLTFQVVDSTGKAIQADQAVDVDFRFGNQPGDATLTPSTVQTNGQGQATVNASSGTFGNGTRSERSAWTASMSSQNWRKTRRMARFPLRLSVFTSVLLFRQVLNSISVRPLTSFILSMPLSSVQSTNVPMAEVCFRWVAIRRSSRRCSRYQSTASRGEIGSSSLPTITGYGSTLVYIRTN